jgi:low affinity Fe/Cu permease
MKDLFRKVSIRISTWAGSALAFCAALFVVLVWASSGPAFGFSDTWQLVINTGTTIVTFLMVFLIQNTQNRDGKAMQLKLDELIMAHKSARDSFIGLEDLTDDELLELDNQFKKMYQDLDSTKAMKKLHEKIEAEHAHRISLKKAGHVMSNLLNPLEGKKK